MTDISMSGVQSRTITAFFDSREAAQKGVNDLIALGIPRQQIRMTEGADPSAAGDKSFWDELKDLFVPDEDRYGYAEGLRRGGYLLSVQVDDPFYNQALDVLDTDGAVDMDQREESWRSTGWTGYQAPDVTEGTTDVDALAKTSASNPTQIEAGRDEVIPIYEETMKIGKRDLSHGRVRLRSYTVETPVSEQVTLRSEQVQIERRPVDRPVAAGDAVFQDRVIEAEEHTEEAVIAKETRVKEEISLRKTVENTTQTVSDTVRRTEVEVEDDRPGRALGVAQAFSTAASQIVAQMDVIASDGTMVGTVDHLDGDRIKLAKSTSPEGEHHHIPLTWVGRVDNRVHLNRSVAEAKAAW